VPTAKERCVIEQSFVHGVGYFLIEPITLTVWAGSDETCYVDEASGPIVAGCLKLRNGRVAALMACCTAMAGPDEVEVFR
jgi:hypothetical protein